MQVYVQKSIRTTLPRSSWGGIGAVLIQVVAPAREGIIPSGDGGGAGDTMWAPLWPWDSCSAAWDAPVTTRASTRSDLMSLLQQRR